MKQRPLTVPEAAEALGVSASFLNSRRTLGGGPPFFKFGRKVVYDPADLEAWMNSRRVSSTSQPLEQVA